MAARDRRTVVSQADCIHPKFVYQARDRLYVRNHTGCSEYSRVAVESKASAIPEVVNAIPVSVRGARMSANFSCTVIMTRFRRCLSIHARELMWRSAGFRQSADTSTFPFFFLRNHSTLQKIAHPSFCIFTLWLSIFPICFGAQGCKTHVSVFVSRSRSGKTYRALSLVPDREGSGHD